MVPCGSKMKDKWSSGRVDTDIWCCPWSTEQELEAHTADTPNRDGPEVKPCKGSVDTE
jgi:hypothetical protein